MPVIETKGAASSQGFGEFAKQGGPATYIEDVFSTYLYAGTGAAQTITNNIDLSTKGGMTWLKDRVNASEHFLYDTNRGIGKYIASNATYGQQTSSAGKDLTAFNTNGFSLGLNQYGTNDSTGKYASWTFRKQPKFFDIVTYTGTGSARTIAHNLGSTPGCIIVKRTDTTGNWQVYHRELTSAAYSIQLNLTSAQASANTVWNSTAPTSSVFSVGTDATVNASGGTYVAYLFAHNAGGFGASGADNVISCGSYEGNGNALSGSGTIISLGYEPQWVIVKNISAVSNWSMADNMRQFTADQGIALLRSNTTEEDYPNTGYLGLNSTGFQTLGNVAETNAAFNTYIYIAIRRPNKPPTSGTQVYNAIVRSGTGAAATVTTTNRPDVVFSQNRNSLGVNNEAIDRLRGVNNTLCMAAENAETGNGQTVTAFDNLSYTLGTDSWNAGINNASGSYVNWILSRCPGFFDVVCYTGTAGNLTLNHNLQVVPELIIFKQRGNATDWWVWHKDFTTYPNYHLILNSESPQATGQYLTEVTSTTFTLANAITTAVNANGGNYVAYLFATCAGVSKVGSYTGNGTSQTINCGFATGARFILIKRTDSSGDWYVWDSARGIVAGNDPHLSLNTVAAEVTTDDSVDTDNSGFIVNQLSATNINVSSATYIYLAIA